MAACAGWIPAKSTSPDVSAASLVLGSSTTTTTNRSSRGGPPSAAGNVESAAKTQRRRGSCDTKRKGPLPTGWSFHAASRRRLAGTVSSNRLGRIARSEEHTSELQSRLHLVCRLLLEKKKKNRIPAQPHSSCAP